MPEKMRAKHEVFGVKDVPKTAHYLENGWVEVDPSTPTAEEERRRAVNEARRGTLTDRPAPEVVASVEALPAEERERVAADEKSGKARKTVLKATED